MANKHLSYRQFKNIFGDLGVTAWTKYNWLSNGIPDGWARVDVGTLDITRVKCKGGSDYFFSAEISNLPNNTQTIGQPWKDVACDGNIDITTVTYAGETPPDAAYVKKAGCSANNGYVCFYFDYSKAMTVEEFKEWIKGKYFYYKLAVPQ